MTNFDVYAPIAFKTSAPDWMFDGVPDELFADPLATTDHSPVLVDCDGDTRYAICVKCDQNVESWWFDGDDDRLAGWGAWGVRVEFANGATLKKVCRS